MTGSRNAGGHLEEGLAVLPQRSSDVLHRRPPSQSSVPLTFAQERILASERLFPGTPIHNVSLVSHLQRIPDIRVFDRCYEELVRRHEALRTAIEEHDGRNSQRVVAPFSPDLIYIDLRRLPRAQQFEAARREAARDASSPFDLAAPPLARLTAMQLDNEEWLLSIVMHHLISDAWSLDIFDRELRALAEAFSSGRASPLPDLPVHFPDYATWQRERAEAGEFEAQASYWRSRLEGAPWGIAFGDLRAAAGSRPEGAIELFQLDSVVAEALRLIAAEMRSSVYMILLAAYFALLFRRSGQADLIVLSPSADRRLRSLESMLGLLLNTLTLRVRVEEHMTFRALVSQVRTAVLEAYEHQDFPADRLLRADAATRDSLARVTFGLQSIVGREASVAQQSGAVGNGWSKFDLSLLLSEAADGYIAGIEYRTSRFEAAVIRRMATQYSALLRYALSRPDDTISRIPLLSKQELAAALIRSTGPSPALAPLPLPVRVSAIAANSPDAPAIIGPRSATYAELDAASQNLAASLAQLGIGKGARVAVLMAKTPEWIAAFLAILRCGAVYVPIDPEYPLSRIRLILEDSAAALLLTGPGPVYDLASPDVHVLRVDGVFAQSGVPEAAGMTVSMNPDDPAYQIYTSGSTGKPKGVQLTHRGLACLAGALTATLHPGPQDCVLAFASPGFDASIFELTAALAHGAALCLETARNLTPGPALLETLERTGATFLTIPPTVLAETPVGFLPKLRILVLAGERCIGSLVDRWRAPHRRIVNAYGPSECTVWATFFDCADAHEADPPIGRPIPGARVYIVDTFGNLCSDEETGEIWIGGDIVGRGYWKRPELSAERFLPDPFHTDPKARIYRTGDAGRRRSDGQIEFRGRLDRQLKIHGVRIEPDELEVALQRCAGVKQAAVAVRPASMSADVLVAWVIAEAALAPSDLRKELLDILPRHMVPTRIHVLDAFPMTPNGKIDYQALASGERLPSDAAEPSESEIENRLALLWKEVLGVENVSSDCDFFELGGHSLLLGRLSIRIREIFRADLPAAELFESPLLKQMARKVESAAVLGASAETIPRIARAPLQLDAVQRRSRSASP